MRLLIALLAALLWPSPAPAAAVAPRASEDLNRAAALYYQGRFAEAGMELETLLAHGTWKRRDSLVLHQYLGMSAARLGRDTAATAHFLSLLAMDSLFRFPKNEDSAVLAAFGKARERRAAPSPAASASPAVRPDPAPASPAAAAGPLPAAPAPVPSPSPPVSIYPPPAPAASGREMHLGYGAIPFGAGWMMRQRVRHGAAMGSLQAAGLLLSVYASQMQTREQEDAYGVRTRGERTTAENWQWVQRISLSIAVGTYLFSIFAAAGE